MIFPSARKQARALSIQNPGEGRGKKAGFEAQQTQVASYARSWMGEDLREMYASNAYSFKTRCQISQSKGRYSSCRLLLFAQQRSTVY